MCGIIGFVKNKNHERMLNDMLEIQEHRGTDSYGAVFYYGSGKEFKTIKELKKEKFLKKFHKIAKSNYKFVIIHHRWASIGKVTKRLAHPITKKGVAIIHNGTKKPLYELYKDKLQSDTEVIAHLASLMGFKSQAFREMLDGVGVVFGFDKERAFFHHDDKRSLFMYEDGSLISSEPVLTGNWQLIEGKFNFGFKTWNYFIKKLKFAKKIVNIKNGEYLIPEYCYECDVKHLHTEEDACVVCKAKGRPKKYYPSYSYGSKYWESYYDNGIYDNEGVDLVFVYGTLKQGYGNHYVMQEAGGKFIGKAMTLDDFYIMGGGGIPYVIESDDKEKSSAICGELYKVKNFEPLDTLEGHPSFYRRELIEAVKENGEIVDAWMYFYTGEIEPRKDWLKEDCYKFPKNADYNDVILPEDEIYDDLHTTHCELCGEEIHQGEYKMVDGLKLCPSCAEYYDSWANI